MYDDLQTQLRKQKQKQDALIKKRKAASTTPARTDPSKPAILTELMIPKESHLPAQKTPGLFAKCDEVATYGTLDAEIQQIFPFYATSEGNVQLPIACMKRNAELIIMPSSTYVGLYDGYLNDNLNSFSVRLRSSEIWIYTNGDCADAHSLHFHLTSGYASPQSNYNSPGLLSCQRLYNPLTYPRDIYQIGPQEIVSFYLTWPYYASFETTGSPDLPCLGGFIHCHFLQHNDANSMIIQYYVDSNFGDAKKKNNLCIPELRQKLFREKGSKISV
jgi:hypothetical protein